MIMQNVVTADVDWSGGNEVWVITLACGHAARRMKRARNKRVDKPKPKRLACAICEAEAADRSDP
jgi:hemolysin-activating ACP:hemolysin acyltransferase